MVGIICISVSTIAVTYAVDCYKPVAGQIMVISTVVKNTFGFGMTYYINPWAAANGFNPPAMLLMAITTGFGFIGLIVLLVFGKKLRSRTRNAKLKQFVKKQLSLPFDPITANKLKIYKASQSQATQGSRRDLLTELTSGTKICVDDWSTSELGVLTPLSHVFPHQPASSIIHLIIDCTAAVIALQPSSINTLKGHQWTYPLKKDIEVVRKRASDIVSSNIDIVKPFQRGYNLPLFNPPANLSEAEAQIVTNLRLPQNPKNPRLPMLLIYRLGELSQRPKQLDDLLGRLETSEQTASLLGTSGSGKTRTLIEMLCERDGFYFSGEYSADRVLGASDIQLFKEHIKSRLDATPSIENNDYTIRYMKCILLARVYVLWYLLFCTEDGITKKDWTLFQILPGPPNGHGELFNQLTPCFTALDEDDLQSELQRLLADLVNKVGQGRFPAILDESVALMSDDLKRFKSRSEDNVDPPLYTMVVQALESSRFLYALTCGTGMGLQIATQHTSSDKNYLPREWDTHTIVVTEGFDDANSISSYLRRMQVPCSIFDKRSLPWLVGRYEFCAKFVQIWVAGFYANIREDAILRYKLDFINRETPHGIRSSIKRMVTGTKKRIVEGVDLMDTLEECVLKMYWFGRSLTTMNRKKFPLFEKGIARLCYEMPDMTATISEPLVVAMTIAVLKEVKYSDLTYPERLISALDYDPSSQGKAFEILIPERIEELVSECSVFFTPSLPEARWTYSYQGTDSKTSSDPSSLNIYCKQHTLDYRLPQYLESP
ncbi:hypothetical protein BZG36_03380, partial [Bifiguratus adelaidae]